MNDKLNDDDQNALSYEANTRYLIEISNRRAWLVAFLSMLIAVCAIIAVCILTPLKSVEPYVIRVDNASGMVDILTTMDRKEFTQNEAIDKYFTSSYVKIREGYFFNILEHDYLLTQIYSSPQVAEEYRKIYEGKNSRVEVLKDKVEVRVDINSVVLGESAGVKIATIRFHTIRTDLSSKTTQITAKIATIAYDYAPQDLTDEEERLQNPLGFKILNYRVDSEVEK